MISCKTKLLTGFNVNLLNKKPAAPKVWHNGQSVKAPLLYQTFGKRQTGICHMYRSYNEYADRLIQELSLKRKSGNEYGDAPCPNCGGDDRFYITELNGELKHHCRKDCNFIERDKELQKLGLLPSAPPTAKQAYHEKKGIPLLGAKLDGNKVIVSLISLETGEDTGTQEISPNGFKKFPKGTKIKGAGAYIGDASDVLYVCEGWATSVAVHLATGKQVLFALNDKGIPKAVRLIDHPKIIIRTANEV